MCLQTSHFQPLQHAPLQLQSVLDVSCPLSFHPSTMITNPHPPILFHQSSSTNPLPPILIHQSSSTNLLPPILIHQSSSTNPNPSHPIPSFPLHTSPSKSLYLHFHPNLSTHQPLLTHHPYIFIFSIHPPSLLFLHPP